MKRSVVISSEGRSDRDTSNPTDVTADVLFEIDHYPDRKGFPDPLLLLQYLERGLITASQ